MHVTNIFTKTDNIGYEKALELAKDEARQRLDDPMLLAWYEQEGERFSPRVQCCGEDEPAWAVYARSRGGKLRVEVNKGEYIFIFR
ncbi:MAG: AF1514 family protein [Thermodesulfobacteriota bacterium]|nr:AF1514 family protein [Thermodesulfobacteriota bacterium]